MKHALAAVLALAASAYVAPAQQDTTRRPPPDLGAVRHDTAHRARAAAQDADARALLRLEDGWAAALVRRDSAYFQRTLAPRFVYTENDRLMTRDEVVHSLVAGTDTVQAAHNEDMAVHAFGPAAVVTGWLVVSGRGASGAFTNRYRFTDTWVKRGGRWQIVAAQDYLAPQGGR